ncbi:short chain dehydrogenase [Halalkalibacter wakoensis JCM 9140]|uniref:Short chain dehydrogenase n=1 Tax=Halalkalibacter wakoensis JCM 9140 TaxID=1236970 RepID=W4Q827_9BACI|nr:SDR family oxidoreductase [Halalkalibacter wakoensis]GAE28226.1 short chain dehydrogenase [Halalkalibacter wakoensis JCM 9140]
MQKTAIVTGASSGFGLLTTIELAKRGFHVVATMRNVEKRSVYKTLFDERPDLLEQIEFVSLDVSVEDSINQFAEYVNQLKTVDVLINNAGFAMGGFAEQVSISDYRRQFETNVFGVMAVTQAVLPKMREQKSGKIINVGSVSGLVGFPGLSPYAASKHALEGYSESLRLELQPFGIDVALIEPGSYQTNIWSSGMEVSTGSLGEQSPYAAYMQGVMGNVEAGKKKHGDPLEVARLISDLAEKERISKLRYPVGRGMKTLLLLKQLVPWSWWEKVVLAQVFKRK